MKTNLNKDVVTTDKGTVAVPKGNINWKVRAKSPQFWVGLLGVIASPVLAYYGLSYADLTTWDSLGNVIQQFFTNPFLIGTVAMAVLSFIGVLSDPTTKGISDSEQAMRYEEPKE